MHIMAENEECIFRLDTVAGSESNQGILETSPWNLSTVDRGPTNKFRALPFIEENIPVPQFVDRDFLRLEIHVQDIGRVDPVFIDICNPEIRAHIAAPLVLRRTLSPKGNLSHLVDSTLHPSFWHRDAEPRDVKIRHRLVLKQTGLPRP